MNWEGRDFPGSVEMAMRMHQVQYERANRLQAENDRLKEWIASHDEHRAEAQRLRTALLEVERFCPCGARPESPTTHPHSIGCPVGRALYSDGPDHTFKPGTSVDGGPPSDLWCDVCGESRAKAHPAHIDGSDG